MRALSARELLEVWEQGQGRPLHHRALLLLAAACPDESSEALARLSIGSRDARLVVAYVGGPPSRLVDLHTNHE